MSTRNANPFIKLVKNIIGEMENTNFFDQGWVHSKFSDSYNHEELPITGQNENGVDYPDHSYDVRNSEVIDEEYEGNKPNKWFSRTQYFFKLASEHEIAWELNNDGAGGYLGDFPSPASTQKIGHHEGRPWLDINKIYESLPDSAPAGATTHAQGQEGAVKRIELLCQLLKMSIIMNDGAFDEVTDWWDDFDDAHYLETFGLNKMSKASSTIKYLGEQLNSALVSPNIKFLETFGYAHFEFSSPAKNGHQQNDSLKADGSTWISYYAEGELDGHLGAPQKGFSSLNPADRASDEINSLYLEDNNRYLVDDTLQAASPFLKHLDDKSPQQDHQLTETSIDLAGQEMDGGPYTQVTPALRWEQWECLADFEAFLFWTAELIELLDLYYAPEGIVDSEVYGVSTPVFAGGKRSIVYPAKDSPSETENQTMLERVGAGYEDISKDDLYDMLEEIQRLDLLVTPETRTWWCDFLSLSDSVSGCIDSDGDGVVDAGAAGPESISIIDISVCEPEQESVEDPCEETCNGNPNAFVVNWTSLDPGATFLNEKTCEYSVVIGLDPAIKNTAGLDLEPVVREGVEKLLDVYLKSKHIMVESTKEPTGNFWPDSASTFFQTLTGFEGAEGSVPTMDIIFDGEMINQFFGFYPQVEDYPTSAGLYAPENGLLAIRVLVTIPAKLFDKIPIDIAVLREVPTAEPGRTVRIKASDTGLGFLSGGPFTSDMVQDVKSAMRYYAVDYAHWAHFADDGYDYGTLDLKDEGVKIREYFLSLKIVLDNYGFSWHEIEHVEIGFDFDNVNETGEVVSMSANYPGCDMVPINVDLSRLNSLDGFNEAIWTRYRTLAYVQRIPDMWNDVTARVPMEWNDFVLKYTVGISNAAAIDEGMPESANACWADEMSDVASGALADILNGIVDFPTALANNINKTACSSKEFKASDTPWKDSWNDFKDKSGDAWTEGLSQGTKDFFAGDPVWDMLPTIIDEYSKNKAAGGGLVGLWSKLLDKLGRCGILALIDFILGCVLQGVPTADGLAILVEAALRSLEPLELEKLLLGLSPQQQAQIASQVSDSIDALVIAPPWEVGIIPGSRSSGGEDGNPTPFSEAMDAGSEISNSLNVEDGTISMPSESTYSSSTTEAQQNYDNWNSLTDEQKKQVMTYAAYGNDPKWGMNQDAFKEYAYENNLQFTFSERPNAGTLGGEAIALTDSIITAYMDVMLSDIDPEELLAQINNLPGAEIIGSLLNAADCNIPDIFDPPIGEFFKSQQLDFCRGNKPFSLPEGWPNFDLSGVPDLWKIIMESLREAIINLAVMAILKTVTALIHMLLNSLCHLMGAVGSAIAGGQDGFRSAFRDSFCDSEISDEELDQIAATIFANLSGCDPALLQAVATTFISDLSLVLYPSQLTEWLNGEATPDTLKLITEMAASLYPDTFGSCPGFETAEGAAQMGATIGLLIDDKFLPKVSEGPEKPIYPSLCNEDAIESFDKARCTLLSDRRGFSPEECEAQIEELRALTIADAEQLAKLAQEGLGEDIIPPIISPDPCVAAMFPAVDPFTSAMAGSITEGIVKGLAEEVRDDLTQEQRNGWTWGTGGLINMIMSNKRGQGYSRHVEDVMKDSSDNNFPTFVASHLKNNYLSTGDFIEEVNSYSGDDIKTISGLYASFWGTWLPRNFITNKSNIDNRDFGMKDTVVYTGETYEVNVKKPDITMIWEDYRTGDKNDYRIEYRGFETTGTGEYAKSVLNDYYRINVDQVTTITSIPFSATDATPETGFEGEQRSEDQMRDLIDLAEAEDINLDIDEHLEEQKSPRNSLYAKYVLETISNMSSEADTSGMFDEYYDHCDTIVENYLKKFGERIADDSNEGFVHGFPSEFSADADDTGQNPNMIYLDQTFVNPITGVSEPLDPERYGGTADRPAFYIPPPTYAGWGRLLQIFAPDKTGCDPQPRAGADFDQLSEIYKDIYDKIVEDGRVGSPPNCVSEAPWDKILDRASTAGIEMMMKAILRIYSLEWFIIGMPSFFVYKPDFSTMFDDSVTGMIIDSIEGSLLDQERTWGVDFGLPNEYYFSFMEQAVQTYDRMKKRGEITPTVAEQEALDALLESQEKWIREAKPELIKNSYPNLAAGGFMASIASPFGPDATFGAALIRGLIDQALIKDLKEKYWISYVGDSKNLEHTRVLLRRLIKDELDVLATSVSEDIESVFPDIHNAFLANENMIFGSLTSGGPMDVASTPSPGATTLKHDGLSNVENASRIEGNPEGGTIGDISFMLEKYIKVTDYDSSSEMGVDGLTTEEIDTIKRSSSTQNHLQGIINLNDWEDYLSSNSSLFAGKKVKDLWKSWEMGLRIVQVSFDNPLSSKLPEGVGEEDSLNNKAFRVETGLSNALLVPLVSTEKESDTIENNNIETITGTLSDIYSAEFTCLLSDLTKEPRYELIFDYCIPMRRMLSILTIYVMKTLPDSIGSAEDWEGSYHKFVFTPIPVPIEKDFTPGGENPLWTMWFNSGFYHWDKKTLMRRSKKSAKSLWKGYYNATDLDYSPEEDTEKRGGFEGISWSLFWWLRKVQIYDPPWDKDGNVC